jgi:hypothetical protein
MLKHIVVLFVALFMGIVVFGWAEGYSSSFQKCVSQGIGQYASDNGQNQENPIIAFARVYFRCTERFADAHMR